MKFFLWLALLLAGRAGYYGRRLIMREMLVYQRLDPSIRLEYKPPVSINKNKRWLFALALLMVVIDTPALIAMFFLISFVFLCLMLARLLGYWLA